MARAVRQKTFVVPSVALTMVLALLLVALSTVVVMRAVVLSYPSHRNSSESFRNLIGAKIPNIIWCYWEDLDDIPPVVQACIESMRMMNPGYDVRVLGQKDGDDLGVSKYRHANTSLARKTDFVRLEVLERHGGIWMDASTVCTRSLDWVNDKGVDLVAEYAEYFTVVPDLPVIESWFIAARPRSRFVSLWNREFQRINEFETVDAYVKDVEAQGFAEAIRGIGGMKDYLAIHVAASVVMQRDYAGRRAALTEEISVSPAGSGAFRYLTSKDWDAPRALRSLCDTPDASLKDLHAIIKIRGVERDVLKKDPELTDCVLRFIRRVINSATAR